MGISAGWLLAFPAYPHSSIFITYLLIAFISFSVMGASGFVYYGRMECKCGGFRDLCRNFFSAAAVRFSGARVGVAFVAVVSMHRFFIVHDLDRTYLFGLVFLLFFFLAGQFDSSLREGGELKEP